MSGADILINRILVETPGALPKRRVALIPKTGQDFKQFMKGDRR
jgi:hypothetical protein